MKVRIVLSNGLIVETDGTVQEIAELTDALRQSDLLSRKCNDTGPNRKILQKPDSEVLEAHAQSAGMIEADWVSNAAQETAINVNENSDSLHEQEEGSLLHSIDTEYELAESQDGSISQTFETLGPLEAAVRDVAEQFRLLADSTRLQILVLLANQEFNVRELCEILGGQSQPAISHHLALLRHEGLVSPSREGKFSYYILTHQGRTLVEAVRQFSDRGDYDTVDLFRQAADPTRLQVLVILSEGERNVGELCHNLGGIPQPALSHHLARMRHGGLVVTRRAGKFNYYALEERGRELTRLIGPMMAARAQVANDSSIDAGVGKTSKHSSPDLGPSIELTAETLNPTPD
jgi:DNA-binding transcriptional ArsR family regulator